MPSDISIDEELLNQPNDAFDTPRGSRNRKPTSRPVFLTILAILYFISALSGLCGLAPLVMSFQMFPVWMMGLSLLVTVGQMAFALAAGIGLWQMKPWGWWLVTVFTPLSATFSYALSILMWQDLREGMFAYMNGGEIESMNSAFSVGAILGIGVSVLFIGLFLFYFWQKRAVFFGSKKMPMKGREFLLMQLVIVIFSIVLALLLYLIAQQMGFSLEGIFEQMQVIPTMPY